MSARRRGPFVAAVRASRALSPSCRLVSIERPRGFADASPGQFVTVRIPGETAPLLRRPYSIMDLTASSLTLLVKVVGRGSALLAGARPGEAIDVIGPLGGATFPVPPAGEVVLVAGGTGLAPLVFAARSWRRARTYRRTTLLYGAATKRELLRDLASGAFDACRFATIDGSAGFRGDVVSLCADLLERGALSEGALYSCGPRGMLHALVDTIGVRLGPHYASLETVMACGVGACRGCTVPVRASGGIAFRAICSDGTVFPAEEIAWEEWASWEE